MSNPGNATTTTTTTTGESYWDKYSIPRITLGEGLWQLELTIRSNQKRAVICFISEAGEGKSQGVHQVARKFGLRVVDIRTAQFSLIGAGVPQRADDNGFFKIAVPAGMPREGEKCILHFDELNQGQNHALAMFFKLLEDRAMYEYELPDETIIVASMNPSTAMYNVTKIEGNAAMNRRLKKFYLYSTWEEWKKHAQTPEFHYTDFPDTKGKVCHPWVLKYLQTDPKMLYTQKDRDLNKQFCCPATWQTVSLDLYNLEQAGEPLTSDRTEARLAATIGMVNARSLIEYVRNNAVRISPDEILFKYKKNSELRKRVLELQNQPGGDYTQLTEVVAGFLISEKPTPEEVAPQLVLFWWDMPEELSQSFYSHLGQAAQNRDAQAKQKNTDYMKDLTRALMTYKEWTEINQRLNSARNSVERALAGVGAQKTGTDPIDDADF